MKKILVLIASIVCLVSCLVSCQCQGPTSLPIIGDNYEVTKVEVRPHFGYKYTVEIRCTDKKSNSGTFDGNCHKLYTNELYTVGDIITIK